MLRILALVLLLGGCAAPYDYAEDTDFSRFDTVALAPDMDTTSLDGARIADAARDLLPTRGLTLTEPKQASLWLNYRLDENVRLLTTMPSMFGRHGFWDEERVYGARRELHLVLWLEQPGSGRVLWQSRHPNAFPGDGVHGTARRDKISQQVAELLENYPPEQ
ncbi:DUF4136 domain-containing protein [Oceanimonas marisflavi]|uniref:DUF4136 domain-containing protein n=1 Tax=Oceanimonas marisflavi TaxID=2059724 RepID=UPI000D31CD43|nr:DUF4136 domain-containing protein [Oceanimonas marisflavi]